GGADFRPGPGNLLLLLLVRLARRVAESGTEHSNFVGQSPGIRSQVDFLMSRQLGMEIPRANSFGQTFRPGPELCTSFPRAVERRALEFQLAPLVGCRIVGPGPGVSALRHDVSAAKEEHLFVQRVIARGPPE